MERNPKDIARSRAFKGKHVRGDTDWFFDATFCAEFRAILSRRDELNSACKGLTTPALKRARTI